MFFRSGWVATVTMDDAEESNMLVSFNLTLPSFPCQYASVDYYSATGMRKSNITKHIRKWRVDHFGQNKIEEVTAHPKAQEYADYIAPGEQLTKTVDVDNWGTFHSDYDVALVNFFAPWCMWCRKLAPTWEVTQAMLRDTIHHEKVMLASSHPCSLLAQELSILLKNS